MTLPAWLRRGCRSKSSGQLDTLRVIGNNAVSSRRDGPLTDDTETASALFELLNFIVEDRIPQPKKRAAIFEKLPTGAREAIQARDGK